MVSFEIFVKAMPPSISELKVLPSFCFAFKIPDDVAASNTYHGLKIKVQFVQAGLQNLLVDGNVQVNVKAPVTFLKIFVTLLENLNFNVNFR
jgi:hypothetical protein